MDLQRQMRPVGLKQRKRVFSRKEIRTAVAKHEQMKEDAQRMAKAAIEKPFKDYGGPRVTSGKDSQQRSSQHLGNLLRRSNNDGDMSRWIWRRRRKNSKRSVHH
jgi:hypothetical protein